MGRAHWCKNYLHFHIALPHMVVFACRLDCNFCFTVVYSETKGVAFFSSSSSVVSEEHDFVFETLAFFTWLPPARSSAFLSTNRKGRSVNFLAWCIHLPAILPRDCLTSILPYTMSFWLSLLKMFPINWLILIRIGRLLSMASQMTLLRKKRHIWLVYLNKYLV